MFAVCGQKVASDNYLYETILLLLVKLLINGFETVRTLYRHIRATIIASIDYEPLSSKFQLVQITSTLWAEWHNIVFSDNSRFYLGMPDVRRRLRNRRGERRAIAFAVEEHVQTTVEIMVLVTTAYSNRPRLFFVGVNIKVGHYVDGPTNQVTALSRCIRNGGLPEILLKSWESSIVHNDEWHTS